MAGRTCTVCQHPKRAEIERALASGTSYRDIEGQYKNLSRNAVARHAVSHISASIKQSQAAKEEAQALDVVKQLKAINHVCLKIVNECQVSKKTYDLALKAVDRVQRQLELQAKLLGDLSDTPEVNVWLPAPWSAIEQAIADALRPYPEAATAVASALVALDEGGRVKLN